MTTMKVSIETRDRLRSMAAGNDTLEDVVVAALDAYDAQRFWNEVDAAEARLAEMPDNVRDGVARRDAKLEADFDGVE